MRWLLARLEQNPHALFANGELRPQSDQALQEYRALGLLEPAALPELPTTAIVRGRRLLVDNVGGHLEGVPEDCHGARPEALTFDDLRPWRVNLARVVEAIHQRNELSGAAQSLSAAFWLLGEATQDGIPRAVVLGLLSHPGALDLLRGLPALVPVRFAELVVVCPTFQPSAGERLSLAAQSMTVIRLEDDGRFEWPRRRPSITEPRVVLTDEQERAFERAGFRSRAPIVVTGQTGTHGTNVVVIDGNERALGPATFPLFMRLVTALFDSENGYLPVGRLRGGGGLVDEGYYKPESIYQAHDQLRVALGPGFQELVEVGGGMIRLSTHARYVRVDCEALARHRDPRVQQLAGRIAVRMPPEP